MITIHQPIEGKVEKELRQARKKWSSVGQKLSNRMIISFGIQKANERVAIIEKHQDISQRVS